ncbi:MAG: T9SS type A sorting domain-containing protein [Segetibacter sp.]
MVSPNPASSEVTVTAAETMTTTKAGTAAITEVNIYDQLGFRRRSRSSARYVRTTVNLSGLQTGIYIIEIVDGTNKVRPKLSILK